MCLFLLQVALDFSAALVSGWPRFCWGSYEGFLDVFREMSNFSHIYVGFARNHTSVGSAQMGFCMVIFSSVVYLPENRS